MAISLLAAPAAAQPASPAEAAVPEAAGDAAPAAAGSAEQPAGAPADAENGDIVVRAPAGGRGAARVDAEYEINASEIEVHAADTIDGLMEALSARTGTARPVVLVNGERVPGGGGIGSYPPEAIARIQVLPPEAAAAYGYPPGQQLVNIVLKRNFASWTLQGDAGGPTQGGRGQYRADVSRVLISGNNRWSFGLRGGLETMLLDSERDIPASPELYGFSGNIRSAVSGGEIDPELSVLAGEPVRAAAVPPRLSGAPELADFLAGANAPSLADQGRYRSLLPQARSLGFKASLAKPIGDFQSSAQLDVDYRSSESRLGLAAASLLLPSGHEYSPFGSDVIIDRAWESALRRRNSNLGVNLNLGLQGELAGWQAGVGTSLSFSRSDARTDGGTDAAALQGEIDAGSANPFSLDLLALPDERSRSVGRNASFNVNASRSLAKLPAGKLRFSLGAEAGLSRTETSFGNSGSGEGRPDYNQSRESLSGRVSLIVPVNSSEGGPFGPAGGVTLQLSAGGDVASGEALRHQYSYGVSWTPAKGIDVSATINRSTTPPDAGSLSAPSSETPGFRVFDFLTGERVDVVRIDGGNPDLDASTASSFNLRIGVRPAFVEGLSLLGEFRRNEARNGIGQLPALTAAVEAAFPDRITRGPDGRLLRIDARPINIAHATSEGWRSNINLMVPLGSDEAEGDPASLAETGASPGDGGARRRLGPKARGSRGGGANLLFSLSHDWNIEDEVVLRDGLDPIDRLAGDGGISAPRHSVSASAKLNVNGLGLGIDARWFGRSVARSDGLDGAPGTELNYSGKTELGLRMFGSLSRLGGPLEDAEWAKGFRMSLDIDNLFDNRVKVTDRDGKVPLGFTRDELDPLGRTVRFSVRKML